MLKYVFLFVFSVSAWGGGVAAQEIRSLWMNTPVTIDGIPQEWPETFRYYDGKTQLQFAVANDSVNLYVCLKVANEQAQRMLFRSGVEVWLDPKGKRNEAVGVSFPMRYVQDPEQDRKNKEGFQRSELERLKWSVLTNLQKMKIKGFVNVANQVLPATNDYGIAAALGWDSLNILSIEYKIPFALTLAHPFSAKDTLKPVGLGLVEPSVELRYAGKERNADSEENTGGWGSDRSDNTYRNQLGNGIMTPSLGGTDWNSTDRTSFRDRSMPEFYATEEQKIWNKVRLTITP